MQVIRGWVSVAWLAGTSLVATGIIGLACGFPEASFQGGADAANTTDGSVVPTDGSLSSSERDVTVGSIGDAAQLGADAQCVTSNLCDCDNDGYLAVGDACAGNDCNDRHAGIHPNQGFIEEPPESPNNGDWDCNNQLEKLYDPINCGVLGSDQGFLADVDCGVEADFYKCATIGMTKQAPRRQSCR